MAGEGNGYILFRQRGTERLAPVISAMAGVHYCEVTARDGTRRSRRRRLRGWTVLRSRGCIGRRGCSGRAACGCSSLGNGRSGRRRSGLRFHRSERDGSAIPTEAGDERDGASYGDLRRSVVLRIGGFGNRFAAESKRRRGRRCDWFAAEIHAQFAGFGRDGRIYRRCEAKHKMRRIFRRH